MSSFSRNNGTHTHRSARAAGRPRARVRSQRGNHLNPPGAARRPRGTAADDGQTLLSRRKFLYGAAGVGAIALVAGGIKVATSNSKKKSRQIASLNVPEGSVKTLDNFELVEDHSAHLRQIGSFDLPLGSLVFASDDAVAACLVPSDTGSPLARVGIVEIGKAGGPVTVIEKPVGLSEHFEIYDVRASSAGIVWTEANILDGTWRIYTASLAGTKAGSPVLAASGDASTDTPTLAASESFAFWLVNPKAVDKVVKGSCALYACSFGSDDPEKIHTAHKNAATPLYAAANGVSFAARSAENPTHFELLYFGAASREREDSVVLPAGMTPLSVAYGPQGFSFSLERIYNSGEGLSQMGTYCPMSDTRKGDYDAALWFRFGRTPSAPPCWCGKLLVVKSTYAVALVDLESGTYFTIDVDDGADTYGEYTATTGAHSKLVTFTSVDYKPVNEERTQVCRVKIWSPAN